MFELIKNNQRLETIDSLLDNFFSESIYNNHHSVSNLDYNYSCDEDNYYIELVLPGLDKKDINLNISDNFLFLNYESKDNENTSFWKQSFNRRIKLPANIDLNTISAQLKNGILSIIIKRVKEECNMKKINSSFLLYLVSKECNNNIYTKSNYVLLRDTLPKRKRLQLEFLLRKK